MAWERSSGHRQLEPTAMCVFLIWALVFFRFGIFSAVHNTPFLQYSFGRVMLQLEFRESKCKRKDRTKNSHGDTPEVYTHCVCEVVIWSLDTYLSRNSAFLQLNCGLFFFLKYFQTSNAPTWVWMIQARLIALRTVRNGDKKTAFCSSKRLKSYAGDWPTAIGYPGSNPDNNCANGLIGLHNSLDSILMRIFVSYFFPSLNGLKLDNTITMAPRIVSFYMVF